MSTIEQPDVADSGLLQSEPLRLCIGGGDVVPEGWVNVDRRVGAEAYPLAYPDESVDEVYASHVIEHFPRGEVMQVLADWVRVLKPGGRIRVSTPDISVMARMIAEGRTVMSDDGRPIPWGAVLSGGQTDENDFHKSHMDFADLASAFAALKCVGVRAFEPFIDDCSRYPFCANIEARKPTAQMRERAMADRVAGCRTVPRLGWTRTAERMAATSVHAGVDFDSFGGAYADLGFERAITKALKTGREYILVTDYDTVWEPDDVVNLVVLMDLHPEADCIAALQLRRGVHHILFSDSERHSLDTFAAELVPVKTAHFGLTLLRASAFERMPLPWFRHRDNADGTITEADMMFWHKWREVGNTLFLAGHIPVGHTEEFIVWPGQDLKPLYQPDLEYDEHGPPPGVRK